MKKIIFKQPLVLFLMTAMVCAMSATPPTVYAQTALPITAPSAVLYDQGSSRLLYSKEAYKSRPPASTTKLLTAMVVLDHMDPDDIVTIPRFAEDVQPTKIYLREGERYYVRDLVIATLVRSANDAAEVLAHAAAGSRSAFTEMMNHKAREIGAENSRFVTASGLPANNQYSTAYDLALIMRYAKRYPFVVETLGIQSTQIESLDGRSIQLQNRNRMLAQKVIGKTGWTRRARHCFVGSFTARDRLVLVSMLGSNSLWRDLRTLVDYQFGRSIVTVRRNTKLWSRHETTQIQTALRNAGFDPGPADGRFGPRTVRAVQAFQKDQGLTVDGVVGPKTWSELENYMFNTRENARRAQQALKNAGFNPGPVDGVLGPQSTRALREFQQAKGLEVDGVLGSFTWEKLRSYL